MGSRFDSYNGEAFYSDKMDEVVKLLEKSGKLHESQGAMVVDVDNGDSAPCIIIKSNIARYFIANRTCSPSIIRYDRLRKRENSIICHSWKS